MCNGCTRMLQAPILNVLCVLFIRMLQVCLPGCCICFYTYAASVYLDVAYVYNGFKCFLGVFASVSYAWFKCFICFQTYVTIVASGCFKTRTSVASPSSPFCCLVSVLGVGRRRRDPHACGQVQQARRGRAGTGCRTWDGGNGAGIQTEGLAFKSPGTSHALLLDKKNAK
jgi:hypothetical protein